MNESMGSESVSKIADFFLVGILSNVADSMEFFYNSSLVWNSESQKQSALPNALNFILYLAISDMKKVKRMTGQSVPIRYSMCCHES